MVGRSLGTDVPGKLGGLHTFARQVGGPGGTSRTAGAEPQVDEGQAAKATKINIVRNVKRIGGSFIPKLDALINGTISIFPACKGRSIDNRCTFYRAKG